ncbi:MAG TPA: ABC transporter transmembrane domain-containing protein [Alphaproteobacteria bacterium]|nr:ABC transporter transmembrane domain-containing protein [Alphaproteobacteria bacterium]
MTESARPLPKLPFADSHSMALMRRLLVEAVKPYAGRLLIAAFFMGVVAAATATSAWLLDPVINKVFVQHDRSILLLIGAAAFGVVLVKSVASYVQETLLAYVGQRVIADMQSRLFSHIIRQDVALFQERHSGTLISHFTFDISALRSAMTNAVVGVGRDALSVVFLVGVTFYQDWLLASVSLVGLPLVIYPIQRLSKRMRRVSTETQAQMGALNTALSQSFQGIRVIKLFALERFEETRVGRMVENLFKLAFRAARMQAAAQPIVDAFGGLAVTLVIVYGGTRVIDGTTSPGAFFSFIAAVLMAYQPARSLSKVALYLQQGLAAAERIYALLDRAPALTESPDATVLPRTPGAVRLEGVRFTYDEAHMALDGITLEAPAGGITALVGPSGAGKSTIFSLVPRFYDPDAGRVLVNGVDVRGVTFASLRAALAVVSQEVVLFDDTVFNNILCGRLDATAAEVHAAARAAAADEFIEGLPKGYDTRVGEQGLRLSGGQRQRIAIARAILKDAPILLLDEATSALDTESERKIQTALQGLMRGRTTIVIAHRLSTIVNASVIHVMDRGRVIESGTHAQLIAHDGLYARLHAMQFAPSAEPDALDEPMSAAAAGED